jgi:hypothetical protein
VRAIALCSRELLVTLSTVGETAPPERGLARQLCPIPLPPFDVPQFDVPLLPPLLDVPKFDVPPLDVP